MDRRERFENLQQMLLAILDGRQKEIWTAVPGIIQSVDLSFQTCTVQPQVTVPVKDFNKNTIKWVSLPLLVDVVLHFPSGGGYTLTFPVKAGDEALVILASRCIDTWWSTGSNGNPPDLRLHDLSDGVALVGIRSKPRVLTGISSTSTQLRSDDGSTYLDVTTGKITVVAADVIVNASSTTINSESVTVNGKTTFNGDVTLNGAMAATGDVTSGGISSMEHTHPVSGVQAGGSTVESGAPT